MLGKVRPTWKQQLSENIVELHSILSSQFKFTKVLSKLLRLWYCVCLCVIDIQNYLYLSVNSSCNENTLLLKLPGGNYSMPAALRFC